MMIRIAEKHALGDAFAPPSPGSACGRTFKRRWENPVSFSDYHATLLHLFGLDPETLTFLRPGGEASLIDGQKARVVSELLKA